MDNTGKKAKQSTIGYREMLPCGCYLAIEGKNAYVAYDFLSVRIISGKWSTGCRWTRSTSIWNI